MCLRPDAYFRSVLDIDASWLAAQGVRAVFLDLDNTILPRGLHVVPASIAAWVRGLKDAGLKVCILSNSNKPKVAEVARQLELPAIQGAKKPLGRGFAEALELCGLTPGQAVIVGDQTYTDILGAHRAGMRGFLVRPLSDNDLWHTRLLRVVDWLACTGLEPQHAGGREQDAEVRTWI